jgi:protein-S-isoprenylcysteine O-methyltransferase Ste14
MFFHNYAASYEEDLLEKKSGDECRQFEARTGKWVPRIGKER